MRAVLISRIVPAVQGLYSLLRAAGHEPVALLCTREGGERYGEVEALLRAVPPELDVVIPATRSRIASLLRVYEPDVVFCGGFPWKIPADALAVPKHGIVNGHPSLLPRYRGPSPVAWAIRNGETTIGFTFHRMDAELDTGAILAQTPIPLADEHSWEELSPKLERAVSDLFPRVLERLERGDPGDPQPEGVGEYLSFFEPEYAWIDLSRSREEISRQVRAWRFHSEVSGDQGALLELDGQVVRVLRVDTEPPADPTASHGVECADGKLWIVESEPA
jgi:methionyl-tRNA formyltransferase